MPFRLSPLHTVIRSGAIVGSLLAGLTGTVSLPAAAAGFSSEETKAIEKIVRQYLVNHPEVLVEAMQALDAKQQVAKDEQSRLAIIDNKDKIFNNAADPNSGNPRGDVTLVEFFDYQCGYCKAVFDDLNRTITDDGKVRFVYKELPILSPASTVAAKAALAAKMQGKYLEVHNALMGFRGRLDDATIMKLAGNAGADIDRLKKDMESGEVKAALDANAALAEKLGVHGTPAFVIGDKLVPGAVRREELASLITETRKK